ncbi:MAG: ribonuclease HII [Methanomicrobiales archaeon]|nr:ribonuclease HII [Methanomicrobiales archaeon]MDI6875227.1 ribonuclease HII [Methanomicrobiales archaeon]
MAICGVDEAGKGAVLGPLVVAGVSCRSLEDCLGLGIRDSKELSRRQREKLFAMIEDRFLTALAVIPPAEIDAARPGMSLNRRVAKAHAEVIAHLAVPTAYVDACDVNASRYARMVGAHLPPGIAVVAEHSADKRYAIVGAASIVAKVNRDRAIDRLKEEYGDIGSGYPSDATTIDFLKAYMQAEGKAPPFARKSWKTITSLSLQLEQSRITSFPG